MSIGGTAVHPETFKPAVTRGIHADYAASDCCSWVDGDHIEPVEQFPFEQVFARVDREKVSRETACDAAEFLGHLLRYIWADRSPSTCVKSACVRFVALAASLRPELVCDLSYSQIAAQLQVTKQRVSHASLEFSDHYGIKWARSRQKSAREKMREKAMGHKFYNGKK